MQRSNAVWLVWMGLAMMIAGGTIVFAQRPYNNAVMPLASLKATGEVILIASTATLTDTHTVSDFLRGKYQIPVQVIQQNVVPAAAINRARKQFSGQAIMRDMKRSFPPHKNGVPQLVVAITEEEMYSEGRAWDYASYVGNSDDRIYVISTPGMRLSPAPRNSGRHVDQAVFETRMRRLVLRIVGSVHFGIPYSLNPSNVMYVDVVPASELDALSDDFLVE